MEDSAETRTGPPGFGATVLRQSLIDAFVRLNPTTVALLAPPGYGKSILASQIAAAREFDSVVWVPFNGRGLTADEAMRAIAVAAENGSPMGRASDEKKASAPDPIGLVRSALDDYRGRRLCLVLDNLSVSSTNGLNPLIPLLQVSAHPDSALVLTSRDTDFPLTWLTRPWVLETQDLRMTVDEASALVALIRGPAFDGDIDAAYEASAGQAALLSILARHPGLLSTRLSADTVPQDLREELHTLAFGQLAKPQSRLLYAASLLGSGDDHDLARVMRSDTRSLLRQVADVVPLVRVDSAEDDVTVFRVHDVARSVFMSTSFRDTLGSSGDAVDKSVHELLVERSRFSQLFSLLLETEAIHQIPQVLEKYGAAVLATGDVSVLASVFKRLSTQDLLGRPKLLLLKAELMRQTGQVQDAIGLATTARDLAKHGGLDEVEVSALLLLSRLHLDLGGADLGTHYATQLLADFGSSLSSVEQVLVHSNEAVANGILMRLPEAEEHIAEIGRLLEQLRTAPEARARAMAVCAAVRAAVFGESRETASDLTLVANTALASVDTRIGALQNLGAALCETGRLGRAAETLERCTELARKHGLRLFLGGCLATLGGVAAGRGEYEQSELLLARAMQECETCGDLMEMAHNMIYRSAVRRSAGAADSALDDAEQALELLSNPEVRVFKQLAQAERAASLLLLGDVVMAEGIASELHPLFRRLGARYHSVRTALILEEIGRRGGSEGTAHLPAETPYILSGNANWVCAMYIRAFPGLLGVLAAAIGPERIPSHLLRMILPENAEVALPMARDVLDDDRWHALAVRMVGEEDVDKVGSGFDIVPQCRVRLFGGLAVTTSDGPVADSAWKKRKARLLFAMLVVRKGKDVPREQLLEYLWPEMDDERARANFYVVWNNMKRALSPNLGKGEPCPYVRAAGGVCRVDDVLVTTDLDDFEQSLLEARRAETAEDTDEMLHALGRVAEIYHGDLLPGDIYDDWFAPLRERCRQEFGDAMLRAAELHEERGDVMAALRMIRAALTHDAWREDLYQAALRYQIEAGQRSAAIETYMTCMHRLSEDLGLDPSVETRRLYDRVLAMEEGPAVEPEAG